LDLKFEKWQNRSTTKPNIKNFNLDVAEDISGAIIASKRKYKAVELRYSMCGIEALQMERKKWSVLELLERLATTTTDLRLSISDGVDTDAVTLILFIMQNVTKLDVRLAGFSRNVLTKKKLLRLEHKGFNFMAKLEQLKWKYSDEILPLFRGCKKLKSFTNLRFSWSSFEAFIAQQERLEHLDLQSFESILKSWPSFQFKLKSLAFSGASVTNFQEMAKFLKSQPLLESLDIHFNHSVFKSTEPSFMKTVLALPKLTKLCIYYTDIPIMSLPNSFFDNLDNNSIKHLELHNFNNNFTRIANSLHAVEKIRVFDLFSRSVDISHLSFNVISKTSFSSEHFLTSMSYSTPDIPKNREDFEKAVICFLKKNRNIRDIEIGQRKWLMHQDKFQLSEDFCKKIVDNAPSLKELELFNVHDAYANLTSFLLMHESQLLRTIHLHAASKEGPREIMIY